MQVTDDKKQIASFFTYLFLAPFFSSSFGSRDSFIGYVAENVKGSF